MTRARNARRASRSRVSSRRCARRVATALRNLVVTRVRFEKARREKESGGKTRFGFSSIAMAAEFCHLFYTRGDFFFTMETSWRRRRTRGREGHDLRSHPRSTSRPSPRTRARPADAHDARGTMDTLKSVSLLRRRDVFVGEREHLAARRREHDVLPLHRKRTSGPSPRGARATSARPRRRSARRPDARRWILPRRRWIRK